MDRRQFLAAGLAVPLAGAASDDLPIIDTHQHLWDLRLVHLPWVRAGTPLARSFTPADYRQAVAGLNVVKAVYMEVDVTPEQQQFEADWIWHLCRRGETPTVAAVVSGRPGTDPFAAYVEQFKGDKFVKGVRRVLHGGGTPPGTCLKPEFVRDIRLLGTLGLSFDLCVRPAEIPDATKLTEACPDTRFILDHCGNPDLTKPDLADWKRDVAALAKRPNVVCKVSGFVAGAKPGWAADDLAPVVNHVAEAFGPDRVLFGGDWPVCTLRATFRQWVEALRAIVAGRPRAEQVKLFHDNAARFYGLA
jgi:L-fuconolactonase